ncbi:CBS domain-containing protein [Candidatus Woesearchaeota archaeon]|nr:CBS domain-containing protein [Candidatus Woesearchaeota archaeon]
MKVKELMTKNVLTCAAEDPVFNVVKKMVDQDVGLLVVVEDNLSKRPIGVLSDRDILDRVFLKKGDPLKTTAADVATKKIISIGPTATMAEASAMMKKNKVKRLAVLDEMGNLVGIISQTDFMKQFIAITDQLADLSSGL